jgi:glucan phosphoethanolaminetransferase (alkaline phosphatase superfamily)
MALAAKTRDSLAMSVGLLFPVVMAWLYFVVFAADQAGANPALQISFATGKVFQALFPVLYVWWFERQRLVLRPPTLRGAALAAGFGLLVAFSILGLYHVWLKHNSLLSDAPARVWGIRCSRNTTGAGSSSAR